jgi:hypothetical protein
MFFTKCLLPNFMRALKKWKGLNIVAHCTLKYRQVVEDISHGWMILV